jgi:short-subunit dehydrogenase
MSKLTVAITGVAGGIGEALTKKFLKQNFEVIGLDFNSEQLDQMKSIFGKKFHTYKIDLTNKTQREDIFNKIIEEHQIPDIWINNAGIADLRPYLESGQERFDQVMNINFTVVEHLTRFWLEKMNSKGGGSIANEASVAGHIAVGGMASYVASKFAVVGFTKSLQQELELEKSPVKLILVSPGFVETKIMQISEKYGFPEQFKFLISTPESCAQEMVDGILNKDSHVTPTLNGKMMMAMERLSPWLNKSMGKGLLSTILKKSK